MKLKRITWSELKPVHQGSELNMARGSVEGVEVLFVMGSEGSWTIGPMFGATGAPDWFIERCHRSRPTLDAAKQAARELMEAYLRLITVQR